jgi:hypothetical protein
MEFMNSLNRGDIVAFFASPQRGGQLEHSHTALGTTDHMMYAANNEPQFNPGATWTGSGTWKWWVTTSQIYWNNFNNQYYQWCENHPPCDKSIPGLGWIEVYHKH